MGQIILNRPLKNGWNFSCVSWWGWILLEIEFVVRSLLWYHKDEECVQHNVVLHYFSGCLIVHLHNPMLNNMLLAGHHPRQEYRHNRHHPSDIWASYNHCHIHRFGREIRPFDRILDIPSLSRPLSIVASKKQSLVTIWSISCMFYHMAHIIPSY